MTKSFDTSIGYGMLRATFDALDVQAALKLVAQQRSKQGCRSAVPWRGPDGASRSRSRHDRGAIDIARKSDTKSIKLKQIGSSIRRPTTRKAMLVGLGLGKMHCVVELHDASEVRGTIAKLPHMVSSWAGARLDEGRRFSPATIAFGIATEGCR